MHTHTHTHMPLKFCFFNRFQWIPFESVERVKNWAVCFIFRFNLIRRKHAKYKTHTCGSHYKKKFVFLYRIIRRSQCLLFTFFIVVYVTESSHNIISTLALYAEDCQGLKLFLSSSAIVQYADSFCKYHIVSLSCVENKNENQMSFFFFVIFVKFDFI